MAAIRNWVSVRRAFHKYPNGCLLESGTHTGEGIQDWLSSHGTKAISCEIVPALVAEAKALFKYDPRVTIHEGSSAKLFPVILKDIKEPLTVFLDGHWSLGRTSFDPEAVCPLMHELDALHNHTKETGIVHTILVDDRQYLGKKNGCEDGFLAIAEEMVINKLRQICPDYWFRYEDGHVPRDIIAAYVPREGQ